MRKRIISFSLWGTSLKYLTGAIENIKLAQVIFPNWHCRFYVGKSTWAGMPDFMEEIESFPNTEIVRMQEDGNWEGMFWRFLPCSDPEVDIFLSRDTDSRLSIREKAAVDEWLASDKLFHIIRDHPFHDVKIMGGIWGAKRGAISNMEQLIDDYKKGDFWQVDQNFLSEIIYPLIEETVFIHDEFGKGERIPADRKEYEFVGDSFDEFNKRHPEYWKEIKNFFESKKTKSQTLKRFWINKIKPPERN